MSENVIDLIDNVVARHGDAMRWSPDPGPQSQLIDLAVYAEKFERLYVALNEGIARALPGIVKTLEFLKPLLAPHMAYLARQERRGRRRRGPSVHSQRPRGWR